MDTGLSWDTRKEGWILIDLGKGIRAAEGFIMSSTRKGPMKQGVTLHDLVASGTFRVENQTSCSGWQEGAIWWWWSPERQLVSWTPESTRAWRGRACLYSGAPVGYRPWRRGQACFSWWTGRVMVRSSAPGCPGHPSWTQTSSLGSTGTTLTSWMGHQEAPVFFVFSVSPIFLFSGWVECFPASPLQAHLQTISLSTPATLFKSQFITPLFANFLWCGVFFTHWGGALWSY